MPLQSFPKTLFWGQCSLWLRTLGALLLVAALLWLSFGLWQAWQQQEEIHELQNRATQIEAQTASLASIKPSKPTTRNLRNDGAFSDHSNWSPEQRRQLSGVIRQLNTPWHDLFEQLERSTPKEIALISIEPDARRGSLRLQAEAKTLDTLLIYADRLQNQGAFGQLTYSKHETNDQDPNKPIRLSIEYSLQTSQRLQSTTAATGSQK